MKISSDTSLESSYKFRPPTGTALLMRGWYDAKLLTLNGSSKVSSWTDISGRGNHLTQVTPAATVSTNAVNGRPAVLFPGTSSLTVSYGSLLAQPWTLVFVVLHPSSSYICDGIDSSNRCSMATFISGLDMYAGAAMDGTTSGLSYYRTVVAVFNGASSFLRVNGVQVATGNPSTQGLNGITIGSRYDGTTSLTGGIAETIHYNSLLSATDILRVEKYTRSKYRTW